MGKRHEQTFPEEATQMATEHRRGWSTSLSEMQIKTTVRGTSLVAQWLRIRLPVQETWVQAWSGKIPHVTEQLSLCTTTTEPVL